MRMKLLAHIMQSNENAWPEDFRWPAGSWIRLSQAKSRTMTEAMILENGVVTLLVERHRSQP